MENWPLWSAAALTGTVLGSYAVTAGLRFSRAQPSGWGRSRCDDCERPLGFTQTIPVLSYMRLKGVCAHCRCPIDPLHFAGELAGAVVLLCALSAATPMRMVLLAAVGLSLVAATAVDLKVRRLPDVVSAIIAAAGLALSVQSGASYLLAGILAAVASVLVLALLRESARRTRGDPGLGLGDVKLIAALSLWLGIGTPAMVFLAALLGLGFAPFVKGPDGRLPFGPMIAVAGWTVGLVAELGWAPWAL